MSEVVKRVTKTQQLWEIKEFFKKIVLKPEHPLAYKAVLKGLDIIEANQTLDERATDTVRVHNCKGWRPADVQFANSVRDQAHRNKRLTPKQIASVARMLSHYSRQLLEHKIANGNKPQPSGYLPGLEH